MIKRQIGEVFIDNMNFAPAKRLKCMRKSNKNWCSLSCIYMEEDCTGIDCYGIYFIETDEPITTE